MYIHDCSIFFTHTVDGHIFFQNIDFSGYHMAYVLRTVGTLYANTSLLTSVRGKARRLKYHANKT